MRWGWRVVAFRGWVLGLVLALVAATVPAAGASALASLGTGAVAGASLESNLNAVQDADLFSVSCPSAGNCTAVGHYGTAEDHGTLMWSETDGSWGPGLTATLPANAQAGAGGLPPSADLFWVSCASAGNCAAVGDYYDSSGQDGLLVTESAGRWAQAVEAPLPVGVTSPVVVTDVSCASPGNCTAVGGTYNVAERAGQGLVWTETGGQWGMGTLITPPANAAAPAQENVGLVSCASAGNCAVAGSYWSTAYNAAGQSLPFLASQTSGRLGPPVQASLPADAGNPSGGFSEVSCPAAGNCTAVGTYHLPSGVTEGMAVSETAGSWKAAVEVAPPTGWQAGALDSVSCATAGYCTAVGDYIDGSGIDQGFMTTETNGSWGSPVPAALPADAAPNADGVEGLVYSVSCRAPGDCSAIGSYNDTGGAQQGLILNQTGGSWVTGLEAALPANHVIDIPGLTALHEVSCGAVGDCAAVGYYTNSYGETEGLVVEETGRR